MKFLPYDKAHFLEPAHDHDPVDVSHLTRLPLSISSELPQQVLDILPAVCEATSIVFASFDRLDDLLSQRLERLHPLSPENQKLGLSSVQCEYSTSNLQVLRPTLDAVLNNDLQTPSQHTSGTTTK
jgi:hypothetical protein